ncbi:unnamed protein product, partial [Adineta steineri]
YCELLYYAQVLSVTLLNEYHLFPGEVVCQCVERSLSMIVGLLSIEMIGGVYCPLSSENPEHRLQTLVEQTQARLILVHSLTNRIFKECFITYDIDTAININFTITNDDLCRLSNMSITSDNISYIVFTSGSTGMPKAVQVRHRNLTVYRKSLAELTVFKETDNVIQMASCSFDNHFQDIFVTLMIGAGLVMLHPYGNKDLTYLIHEIMDKDVTFLDAVPSYFDALCQYIETQNANDCLKKLRTLNSGGEILTNQIMLRLKKYVSIPLSPSFSDGCQLRNMYGQAESTITSTYFQIGFDFDYDKQVISIGKPLPNYHCTIMDGHYQFVIVNQEGELFVGGAGVFAGYLDRDDLTAKALAEIDNQLFYRTGDLVRIDNNGLLHYQGRKDHQIKLHGQRIELGEIERCLLNITSISACVVMKWNDDYLVAYVQSSHINEEELRQHCQSHLPPHMIPSFFIILDKLPLNANGKVDRKQLPPSHYSSSTIPTLSELDTPTNQIEKSVYDIWCQMFESNGQHISTTANFFAIGGHSRLFIELYHRYQSIFGFDGRTLSVNLFLKQPTIQQHAKLLKTVTTDDIQREQWCTLHINRSMASFAQERIFLDEQIRPPNKRIFYNNFVALRVTEGVLSINRLRQALQLVWRKHEILRTSLVFNNDESALQQYVTDDRKTITFLHQQTFENGNDLQNIIYRTVISSDLFDLSSGRVFCCQVLQQQKTTREVAHTGFLEKSDVLVLYLHHAAIDGTSIAILLKDIYNAYSDNMTVSYDEQAMKYIDYAVYERLMDMASSRSFWYSQLERFDLKRALKLPVDRHRLPTVQRSDLASVAQISFDQELSTMFLNYACVHRITPFQLALTVFYVFLFKLTHEETDLCIACVNANRYRSELENMIGMFVSVLPYCVQLNSHWSFDKLVKHLREKCLSILQHSHYPLQHILTDFQLNQLDVSFLEIVFNFLPESINIDRYSVDNVRLDEVLIEPSDEISQFDFSITFLYNPTSDDHKLSYKFSCSHDLFDSTTIKAMVQRFQNLLSQLFLANSNNTEKNLSTKPIKRLSLILPQESDEIYSTTFNRATDVATEGMAILLSHEKIL